MLGWVTWNRIPGNPFDDLTKYRILIILKYRWPNLRTRWLQRPHAHGLSRALLPGEESVGDDRAHEQATFRR